jgi:Bacterial regulatory proteins, lacI family
MAGDGRGRRVTIDDIAWHAGVSKGAVSYVLNGRPGLSDKTRRRILAVADELRWYPNRAARSLLRRVPTRAGLSSRGPRRPSRSKRSSWTSSAVSRRRLHAKRSR